MAGGTEGAYSFPLAVQDGKRNGVRELIVDTVNAGYPLTVRTQSLVTHVIFGTTGVTPSAIGVEFMDGKHL